MVQIEIALLRNIVLAAELSASRQKADDIRECFRQVECAVQMKD